MTVADALISSVSRADVRAEAGSLQADAAKVSNIWQGTERQTSKAVAEQVPVRA